MAININYTLVIIGTAMKSSQFLGLFFTVILLISTPAYGSYALTTTTIKNNQQTTQQLKVRSSRQAAQMAQSRFGGKVLKVQKQNSGYRVKLIKNNGNIVSVYVDAKSGRINYALITY